MSVIEDMVKDLDIVGLADEITEGTGRWAAIKDRVKAKLIERGEMKGGHIPPDSFVRIYLKHGGSILVSMSGSQEETENMWKKHLLDPNKVIYLNYKKAGYSRMFCTSEIQEVAIGEHMDIEMVKVRSSDDDEDVV